jgi:ATP-dependent DNA ligase
MSTYTFDTLYGIDKNNKTKQWDIYVENKGEYSIIVCSYGYINGKKIESKLQITNGKNIGKKNETTHYEQAIMDAKSKWNKKMTIDGYKTSCDGNNGNINNNMGNLTIQEESQIEKLLPMLAQDYKKQKNKVVYPCYIQPKLDGYRMVYNFNTKQCNTRTGKEYNILYETELYKQLKQLNYNLDGELYLHDSDLKFEDYGVLKKQTTLKTDEKEKLEKVEYHVYDILDTNLNFEKRLELLHKLEKQIQENNYYKIKIVKTIECKDETELKELHKQFLENKYEGTMVRNKKGMYKYKYRSYDLLKYKDFDDGEFKIVDYTYERATEGDNENLIVWICETEKGDKFKVQSKGNRQDRKKIYKEADKYIGKMLWVQYFGLTADNIPRFPKTMRESLESIREVVY